MACIIAAPSSGHGKTLLSLLISSWAKKNKLNIQTFKIGPDYLDSQYLSLITGKPCRNLDKFLSGSDWIRNTYQEFAESSDLVLIEGVMGLFDGIGNTKDGSSASIAKLLNIPVILVVDASRQSASLAALVKGFKDFDPKLNFAGVVLNRVKTERHRQILYDVLDNIGVKVFGCISERSEFNLNTSCLGLSPAHEINNISHKIEEWSSLAESCIDFKSLKRLLKSPKIRKNFKKSIEQNEDKLTKITYPIAIAKDKAFHFIYPEINDHFESIGMPILYWSPLNDEPIPVEAKGLFIPGGFPEKYAQELSKCKRTIKELKNFYGKKPIYAECGGMLILGESLQDDNGKNHLMANLLPFQSRKGNLKIGYRNLKAKGDGMIVKKGGSYVGHEFHKWSIFQKNKDKDLKRQDINSLWDLKGWGIKGREEGFSNKLLHASWIHIHLPSSKILIKKFKQSILDSII